MATNGKLHRRGFDDGFMVGLSFSMDRPDYHANDMLHAMSGIRQRFGIPLQEGTIRSSSPSESIYRCFHLVMDMSDESCQSQI